MAVRDASGNLVNDALVRVYRGAIDQLGETFPCGQAFFTGLPTGTIDTGDAYPPYSVVASADGTSTTTPVEADADGASMIEVTLE